MAIGDDQIIGDRDAWPLYVTDEGIVRCGAKESPGNAEVCDGATIGDYITGRRVTYLEFKLALMHHALVAHNTLL